MYNWSRKFHQKSGQKTTSIFQEHLSRASFKSIICCWFQMWTLSLFLLFYSLYHWLTHSLAQSLVAVTKLSSKQKKRRFGILLSFFMIISIILLSKWMTIGPFYLKTDDYLVNVLLNLFSQSSHFDLQDHKV